MNATRKSALPGRGLITAAAILPILLLVPAPASADTAVLSPNGTLYEVFPTRYAEVVPSANGTADADTPVLALRTTPSSETSSLEVVDGTFDDSEETSISLEFDARTSTLFVAYTKTHGLMADINVAVRRSSVWLGQDILPNRGQWLSLNPKVVVTQQSYLDFDGAGGTVTKSRSIFSLVWWEESGPSQARYAAVFVEDGELRLSNVVAYNLNELGGSTGPTDATGLALSSFVYPSVQRDPATNGGVLTTFANLATRRQQVVRITFPDDITKLSPPGSSAATDSAYARAHIPIGRALGSGRLAPADNATAEIGAIASEKGTTTFFWLSKTALSFTRSNALEGSVPSVIPFRQDLGPDRAIGLVRELATRE